MPTVILLILTFFLIVIQLRIDRSAFDLFNPKNLFQIYFFIQLPLSFYLGYNYDIPGYLFLDKNTDENLIYELCILIFSGHFAFVLGYYSRPKFILPVPVIGAARWKKSKGNFICFMFFILAYIAFAYLLYINGGYANFMANRESWRAGGLSGQGWLIFLSTSVLAITACVFIIINKSWFIGGNSTLKLLATISITLFPASQMGFRSLILLPLLQILFLYHFRVMKINFLRIIVPLFMIVLFFTLYGLYREASFLTNSPVNIDAILDLISSRPEFIFAIFLRSKGADVLVHFYSQMQDLGDYLLLYPALYEAFTIIIPHFIWPGKPIPLTSVFSNTFFGIPGGVSPTIIGELYWHLGGAGVILLMYSLGLIFRAYFNAVKKYYVHDSKFLFLLCIFPSLIMMAEIVQGYLNGIVILYFGTSIISFLMSLRISRKVGGGDEIG